MSGPVLVRERLPELELSIARSFVTQLREQLAEARVTADRRAQDAYFEGRAQGLDEGNGNAVRIGWYAFAAGAITALGVFAGVLALA